LPPQASKISQIIQQYHLSFPTVVLTTSGSKGQVLPSQPNGPPNLNVEINIKFLQLLLYHILK